MLSLHKLNLSHFRNYETLRLDAGGARMVVLTGDNGAGKTNLLEAISLLTAGKGLRHADIRDIGSRADATAPWAVSAEVETPDGDKLRIGTGIDLQKNRRIVRIDGRDAKSQAALAEAVAAVWLTPQMDGLFIEGAAGRRKFLDRLVFAFDPAHAARLSRYEKHLRERLKLLQQDRPADPRWLDALETQAAAEAVAIAAARVDLARHLQSHALRIRDRQSLFPMPVLHLAGAAEQAIENTPAVELEDALRNGLRADRGIDAAAGRTRAGVHRTDLEVFYGAKDMPAAQCSTGEQKALLVAIVLAHAQMMQAEKGFVPLVLLDEVAAHLDSARRAQLFSILSALDGQVWLTGTDTAVFAALRGRALFHAVDNGQVSPA
jgi:DNA replication and repair protein RecF